jgi:hypothetical protein
MKNKKAWYAWRLENSETIGQMFKVVKDLISSDLKRYSKWKRVIAKQRGLSE